MENLGIDLKLIIAQIVSFGIFFFIFKKFVSKPLLTFLKKQKEDEELRAKLASELEKRNEVLEEKDRKMNKERKVALEKAILEGKKEADAIKKDLVEKAKSDAEKMITEARQQIEEEKNAMHKELKNTVGKLSLMLVEQSLSEYLSPDIQKGVTSQITKNLPKVVSK